MRVAVLGAGVVGVTTAWYLARDGHEVTVFDRQAAAGLETSFANGGQVSAAHAEPWANPQTPRKVLKWLGRADAPLVFRWRRWDPALWAWGLRFLRNCTTARAERNLERTLRVALYSRRMLAALRQETGIEYDQRREGILHVYRDAGEFAAARHATEVMTRHGLDRRVLSADECVQVEPALAPVRKRLLGGTYSPDDESGDAHMFTSRLAALASENGVRFRYGTRIVGLAPAGDAIEGMVTDAGTERADAYVVALGSFSPFLLRPLGLRLPVYPAKGYSGTISTRGAAHAPTVSVTDDENKIVYSRLGERLRFAGTAELAGWDASLTEARAAALVRKARELFPEAGDYGGAELWAGLRPVTPDSVPIIGRGRWRNLFLNTGHGTLGWTMSCGSARIVADLVTGRAPAIEVEGLGPERFGRRW